MIDLILLALLMVSGFVSGFLACAASLPRVPR